MPISCSYNFLYLTSFSTSNKAFFNRKFNVASIIIFPLKFKSNVKLYTIRKVFKKSIVSTFHFITFVRNIVFGMIDIGSGTYLYFILFIHFTAFWYILSYSYLINWIIHLCFVLSGYVPNSETVHIHF